MDPLDPLLGRTDLGRTGNRATRNGTHIEVLAYPMIPILHI
jgi:hypothetical protein